jgi:hypothetical protein
VVGSTTLRARGCCRGDAQRRIDAATGFCALVVHEGVGGRLPSLSTTTATSRHFPARAESPAASGSRGTVGLRDTNGDGRPGTKFGDTGGTGLEIRNAICISPVRRQSV